MLGYRQVVIGRYWEEGIDGDHGYMAVIRGMAILEIPKYKNINSINKIDIHEPYNYQSLQCESAYVVKIFDLETGKPVRKGYSTYPAITFEVGKCVEKNYDSHNLDWGIHCFLSQAAAEA